MSPEKDPRGSSTLSVRRAASRSSIKILVNTQRPASAEVSGGLQVAPLTGGSEGARLQHRDVHLLRVARFSPGKVRLVADERGARKAGRSSR
jgi:hypothetical protein